MSKKNDERFSLFMFYLSDDDVNDRIDWLISEWLISQHFIPPFYRKLLSLICKQFYFFWCILKINSSLPLFIINFCAIFSSCCFFIFFICLICFFFLLITFAWRTSIIYSSPSQDKRSSRKRFALIEFILIGAFHFNSQFSNLNSQNFPRSHPSIAQ